MFPAAAHCWAVSLLEPACGVCMTTGHVASRTAWLWRRQACMPCDCGPQAEKETEREREKENQSFFIILIWAWDGPNAFSKWPINFPGFCGLWLGPHPLVRLTGLCGPAPPSVTPNNLVPEWGKGVVLLTFVEHNACGSLEGEKLQLPGEANTIMHPTSLISMSKSLCSLFRSRWSAVQEDPYHKWRVPSLPVKTSRTSTSAYLFPIYP